MGILGHIIPLLRTLLVLAGFIFALNAVAKPSATEQGFQLQLGDYLSVDYIDVLRQTRSPITACEKSDFRQYIRLGYSATDKQFYFRAMGNFHEGIEGITTDLSLNIVIDHLAETPARLKALSRSEFAIAVDGKMHSYRYVGSLKQFIAKNTIAGKYKDNEGNLYTFTEEGLATFPDRSFQYEVATDLIFGFDQFFEMPQRQDGTKYGFKVVNNELQLFKIVGEFTDEPESIPFITLIRIGDVEAKPY
jgi:hypothetical protein